MGCHTWYRRLITNNQEEVVRKVKDVIAVSKYYNWYVLTSLDDLLQSNKKWEQGIVEYVFLSLDACIVKVNGVFGIYECAIGYDIDEPRIGNYPDTIITSAEEMFRVMENGLRDRKGNHCDFYWDKRSDKRIRDNIIAFFKAHPDGIIEFG